MLPAQSHLGASQCILTSLDYIIVEQRIQTETWYSFTYFSAHGLSFCGTSRQRTICITSLKARSRVSAASSHTTCKLQGQQEVCTEREAEK